MSLSESKLIRDAVNNELLGVGIEPKVAAHISNIASLYTFGDDNTDYSLSQNVSVSWIAPAAARKERLPSLSYDRAVVNQTATNSANSARFIPDASVNETKNISASFDDLDNNKSEEIFSQIDLAQARIAKDQEEIEFLAAETDELLNQLEYKTI